MDVVEFNWMRPRCLHIVHFEFDVSRYHVGLDGTEVIPNYLGVRVSIAHFDAPDARARSDIQDTSRVSKRGQMEFTTTRFRRHFMVDIHTILLLFIVWKDISAFPEGRITAAVLDGIVEHT